MNWFMLLRKNRRESSFYQMDGNTNTSCTEYDDMQSIMEHVFSLLRACLFTDEDLVLDDCESVFEEMKDQAVAALPGEWIQKHPVRNSDEWNEWAAFQQAHWIKIMVAQDQLLRMLEEELIPCVVIKGAAAAIYYPYPYLRSMGDVDILVKRCDLERTALLFEQNGYLLIQEKDYNKYHYSYRKDDVCFELHWRLPVVSDKDERLLGLFETGITKRRWGEIDEFRFPLLQPVLNGLVLIFHIKQHMGGGLGLRQIIDWMMYVNNLDKKEWDVLIPILQDTGVKKLAFSVTAMCQKHLGLRKIIQEHSDDYPCDALATYLMENGNFGRKGGIGRKTADFTITSDNLISAVKRLQKGGLCRWKAARQHKILRPFAWIYQLFRIIGVLIANRNGPGKILEQKEKGLEYRELIEALGLQADSNSQRSKRIDIDFD